MSNVYDSLYDSEQRDVDDRPILTDEAREMRLIALATDLAEKQLKEGTASSQVITHYLKLGSTREKIEKDILREQKKLIQAKTEQVESSQDIKQLYEDAMQAFKTYTPSDSDPNVR